MVHWTQVYNALNQLAITQMVRFKLNTKSAVPIIIMVDNEGYKGAT